MDPDPAQYRHRDAAGAGAYVDRRAPPRRGVSRSLLQWLRVLPYLAGETDGQPKDAGWVTAIPAETIRDLARQMADTRTMLTASWSLQRADHGEQPYWALVLLAACLGQIGLSGGGFGFGYGSGASLAEAPNLFPSLAMPALPSQTGYRAFGDHPSALTPSRNPRSLG
jgi:anaerobic selenocysteine-containing dehydrogenase